MKPKENTGFTGLRKSQEIERNPIYQMNRLFSISVLTCTACKFGSRQTEGNRGVSAAPDSVTLRYGAPASPSSGKNMFNILLTMSKYQ